MSKAPAFQFYANDFMDATRFWEANAVGLYIRCLCIQWTQGGLPADVRTLSKGVGMDFEAFEAAWPIVREKFEVCEDGALRNKRLEAVRTRQEDVSSKRSKAGKAGAIARSIASTKASTKTQQRKVKVKEKVEGEGVGEGVGEGLPFESPQFAEAAAAWEQHRKEIGHTLTPLSRSRWLKKCEDIGEARAIAAIDHSIEKGWTGMYEADGKTGRMKAALHSADVPADKYQEGI